MAGKLACLLLLTLPLTLPLTAAELRIGVLSLFRPERINVRSSEALRVQAGPRTFTLEPGQVAGLRAVGPEIDIFAQQQPSTSTRVVVSGRGGAPVSFRLNIEGKIDRFFTGRLEVASVGSRLEPVIFVNLEAAVAAVVASELASNAPLEAMKAMAVLARSYYAASGRRHGAYDFCDTTHCQWRRETIPEAHPASVASRETEGIVITYDGKMLPAMYHASCGGRTMAAEAVGLRGEFYPYPPVGCEACRRSEPVWISKLPREVAGDLIKGPNETRRLDINRKFGSKTLPGNNYKVTDDGAEVRFEGKGEGHGVGACQRGMISMAGEGQDFRRILSHYLPQTRTSSGNVR